ncbi:hypothetical protein ATANTOWER_017825 [Ataeniobius toweri]|uniref:Fibulin-2 domain-containing protein n=1 Tax=Ataeniobius toweri TaxID=208326 RepID=A0ABU7APT7_9TELE|nr:hypothetical protein [Ataeniobius toweri]
MAQAEVALLRWILLLLFLPVTLSQRDCSGVDCPLLENCIKEVLESGACCPSCLEKGCKCEGYEKYDCSRAGFNNSIVPEGESYFVDYGSTECSCPVGGGPISCRYISCPDMPPNCIEILEPQDSCQQCERIGCVHDGEKYEAGHSFHIEACRVCHCPNEGGQLMCYPVPNCNPQNVHNHNSMLTFPTDDNTFNGRDSYSTRFDQRFASYHHPSSGNLPLFKTSPSDNDDSEEYDYSPPDFSETYPDLFVLPTQSSISSNKVVSIGSERPDRTSSILGLNVHEKMELREQHRVHYHLGDKEEVTKVSLTAEQSTARSLVNATTSWQGLPYTQTPSFSDRNTYTELENPLYAHTSLESDAFPVNNLKSLEGNSERALHHQKSLSEKADVHDHNASNGITPKSLNSQVDINHLMGGTENVPDQKGGSDREEFPLFMLRNMDVTNGANSRAHFPEELHGPGGEEWFKEEEIESVAGTKENDVPDSIRSAQKEKSHMDSESSSPSQGNPDYQQTTLAFLITTTVQPPSTPRLTESLPGRDLLHSPGREDLKVEEKKGEEEAYSPVLLFRPEGVTCTTTFSNNDVA